MNHPPGKAPPRFVIVRREPERRPLRAMMLVLLWLATLAGVWQLARSRAAQQLPGVGGALADAREQLADTLLRYESLKQREATLLRSDQISRVANREMQSTLAQRDAEIAELRADVAFYERLVGATAPKKGLSVHSLRFERETGGTWRYMLVLTQTLNRSAVSLGQLRFSVEGVYDGKLASVAWDELHQRRDAPAQEYSFRYFQQLEGSVMLPVGFTPQRVRVSLQGDGAAVQQTLAWSGSLSTSDT